MRHPRAVDAVARLLAKLEPVPAFAPGRRDARAEPVRVCAVDHALGVGATSAAERKAYLDAFLAFALHTPA